jgi:hypothetical protein
VIFVIQRAWTYFVYAERRLAAAISPLSPADIEWYRRTLRSDYRAILNAVAFALFTAAAFFQPMTG